MLGSSLSYLLWTTLVQFSPFTDWVVVWSGVGDVCVCVGGGGTRDASAEILFQSFLREAIVSSHDKGREAGMSTL